MRQPIRIAINGFGRIGRTVLRQILSSDENNDIEVVAINDVVALKTCAYLLRYDSVFGPFPFPIVEGTEAIEIKGHQVAFTQERDLRQTDLSRVDIVLECTGKTNTRRHAEAGIAAGAKKVLISGPSRAADKTIVLGANEHELGDTRIVSNASCTTNAIAPLLRMLDLAFGIERAHATTIHCYTGSQPSVDLPCDALERSRAAALSMVPTSTSAAEQVIKVLPEFAERLSIAAVRVPSPSVSAVDLIVQLLEPPEQPFNDFLKEAFSDCAQIGLIEDPCVSADLRARPQSLIIALPQTQSVGARQVRLFGWYDNEWGFSARMIDMVRLMASKSTGNSL